MPRHNQVAVSQSKKQALQKYPEKKNDTLYIYRGTIIQMTTNVSPESRKARKQVKP